MFIPLVLVVAGGTWAVFELWVWNRIPAELVGKWVVADGPQEGATWDFFRNGTLVGRVNMGGKLAIVNSDIRVAGQTIYSTAKHPDTGEVRTFELQILLLTKNKLVVRDDKGNVMNMDRAE